MPSLLQNLVESIERRVLSEPPLELHQFAKEETIHQQGGQERRRFRRYSLITNVIVVPLDETFFPLDDPFVTLSSGMSVDGMRLIHTDPVRSGHLFIQVESQPVRFVLSVLRSRPVGECFEIAGRLLSARMLSDQGESRHSQCGKRGTILAVDTGAGTSVGSAPTFEECAQWAGVTAAARLLHADSAGRTLHA
jgi:hypothetical protein